jgi:hypothetical protein
MRKRGTFTAFVPSAGDRWVVDICFTLITSKIRFTKPTEMASVEDETGRYCVTAFIGFWD